MSDQISTKKRWRLLRPFPDAHWLLPVAALAYFEFLIAGTQCNQGPYYPEVAGVAALIVLCLWQADRRCGATHGWRRTLRVARLGIEDLVKFATLLLLVAVPIMIFTPLYQCYTERSKVALFLMQAAEAKREIIAKAEAAGSLTNAGTGVSLKYIEETTEGMVMPNGVIIVVSQKPSAAFVLTPSLVDGKVTWTCRGVPEKSMPALCRH